jgi:hypothetical protein
LRLVCDCFEEGVAGVGVEADIDFGGDFIGDVADVTARGNGHEESGRAYFADATTGGEPTGSVAAGWRPRMIRTKEGLEPDPQPQGHCVGWLDQESAYLDLKAAVAAAQSVATGNGSAIGLQPLTIAKRLYERGLVVSREAKHLQGKKTVAGVRRRVLQVSRDLVLPADDEQKSATRVTELFETQGGAA